jgi:hypothetical protein
MLDATPLEQVRTELAMPMQTLWSRCLGLGGSLTLRELAAYLVGTGVDAGRMNHDVIVHALNEALIDSDREPTLAYAAP